jgi:hypothetical protein
LKRILRHTKGTLEIKLIYKRYDFGEILFGYVDADRANNETDRRSTTGYLFKMFNNCLVTWNTKRQNSVAASSIEAEYMALFEAVKESLLNSIKMHSHSYKPHRSRAVETYRC